MEGYWLKVKQEPCVTRTAQTRVIVFTLDILASQIQGIVKPLSDWLMREYPWPSLLYSLTLSLCTRDWPKDNRLTKFYQS